jgi:integrase
MAYKWDDKTGGFIVWVAERHPKTREPKGLRRTRNDRRKLISTEEEARKIESKLTRQLVESFQNSISPSWIKSCDRAFEVMLNRGISKKTIINYEQCLRAHTYPVWGKIRIDLIETSEIRKLITDDLVGRSDAHKKNILKMIRAVFKQAHEDGAILRNPVPDLRIGRGSFKIQQVLNGVQLKAFLEHALAMNVEWYPVWATAAYTGMRSGELFALTWDNTDLEARKIFVRAAWNNVEGFTDLTKSGDDRIVEIAPTLLKVLRELKLKNPEPHFVLPRIRKWEKGEQARELRMFLMGMGLPPIRFHDLRASWATLMLSRGVEPIKVMSMGGWKDLKTMMIYIRKAGVDIKGITDSLEIHDPSSERGKVLQLGKP